MTNLPATLSTLDQEITVLSERLNPPKPDFIAECLQSLKAGGMLVPKGIAAADFLREYSIAIGGVPHYGLMVVVAKLKRGEYTDVSAEFMPLPAHLAAMARAECRVVRDDIIRLREKRDAIAALKPQPKENEEERLRQLERIRSLHADFKATHTASKVGAASVLHEPMDDEKAEYWRKISELKDAAEPTAEQMAFRRKIGWQVDAQESDLRKAAE